MNNTLLARQPARAADAGDHVLPRDVERIALSIVNAYLVGPPGAPDGGWVLVDAGLSLSAGAILGAVAARYGPHSRPAAIVLTHAHFDHVGALRQLAAMWDVPVYAHRLELPYLTGRSDYPPPDPTVGGGMMAYLSLFYSNRGIDLGDHVQALPVHGGVPGMPGWRWVHTPGHTPGHVAFFRDADSTLIAGDAFVTTRQESMYASLMKPVEVNGPPAYFTPDWTTARRSVKVLAELNPAVAGTGHGLPVAGESLRRNLDFLARHFDQVAVPAQGRYVRQPALADERGVTYVPPVVPDVTPWLVLGGAVVAGLVVGQVLMSSRDRS